MKTKKRKTRVAKPRSTSKGLRVHKATETTRPDADVVREHPIFKHAASPLCSRIFDRAVQAIIEDAIAIAGALPEERQVDLTNRFHDEHSDLSWALVRLELGLAGGGDIDYDNKKQQAAIAIWWPPVHCIRKVFPNYILRESIGAIIDLALAAKQTSIRPEAA